MNGTEKHVEKFGSGHPSSTTTFSCAREQQSKRVKAEAQVRKLALIRVVLAKRSADDVMKTLIPNGRYRAFVLVIGIPLISGLVTTAITFACCLIDGTSGTGLVALFLMLFNLQIQNEFVSDEVVFTAAVLTIATPIVLDTISRIGERYNSDVVAAKFQREIKWMVYLLILLGNIVMAISWKFFGWCPSSVLAKMTAWIVFLSFLAACKWLFSLLRLLLGHGSPDALLHDLFGEANKIIDG